MRNLCLFSRKKALTRLLQFCQNFCVLPEDFAFTERKQKNTNYQRVINLGEKKKNGQHHSPLPVVGKSNKSECPAR